MEPVFNAPRWTIRACYTSGRLCHQSRKHASTSEPLPTPKAELDLQVRGTKLRVISGLELEAPGKGSGPLSFGLTSGVGQYRKRD